MIYIDFDLMNIVAMIGLLVCMFLLGIEVHKTHLYFKSRKQIKEFMEKVCVFTTDKDLWEQNMRNSEALFSPTDKDIEKEVKASKGE